MPFTPSNMSIALLAMVNAERAYKTYLEANGNDGSAELAQLRAEYAATVEDYETKFAAHVAAL